MESQASGRGQKAFVTLGQFLEASGWQPERTENAFAYGFYIASSGNVFFCCAQIWMDIERFIFHVAIPVRVPLEKRPEVAEYFTRANYNLLVGNFEMDYADGEARYKSSLNFEGEELTVGLIRNAIYPALRTVVQYLPGLMSVLDGMSPVEAIASTRDQQ